MTRLLTVHEVCDKLRCSPATVYRQVRGKSLPALRLSRRGRLLFDPGEVRRALRQSESRPAA